MSSLRSDDRTSAAVRGSGWLGNSPQAEQLLAQLAPGERVERLFTTFQFHGALTPRRLLLWRGTFKLERMELRRPLTVLKSESQFLGEVVVLDGPEGAIELKGLSTAVARAVVAAGGQGRHHNTPPDPPFVARDQRSPTETPGARGTWVPWAPTPPRVDGNTGAEERGNRPRTIRTWQDAERAALDHMHSLGFTDARLTVAGADGGIDVIARDAIAQVKHHSQPIGAGPVRELRGVADSHHLLFYASSGFTASAHQFADDKKVALFSLHELGHITPANETAIRLSQRQAPVAEHSRTVPGRGPVPSPRAAQRAAELEAQRQTVLRLITRVRAHTNEVHALPSNRYTKDLIKALKAADKLIQQADSLLARSRADFQTHRGRKQLIAMADEKAREAALKLGMRA